MRFELVFLSLDIGGTAFHSFCKHTVEVLRCAPTVEGWEGFMLGEDKDVEDTKGTRAFELVHC